MTANRMHEWGDGRHTIGFQQADAPVTNTLQVHAGLTDGNVEITFRSTWAQAGASHSTDGALVLSRVDAKALAAVLAPREACGVPASNFVFASGERMAVPDLGDRRFVVEPARVKIEPFAHSHLVAMCKGQLTNEDMRAALMAAGWLPPERLEAIAASWDGVAFDGSGGDVGAQLRKEFKNA